MSLEIGLPPAAAPKAVRSRWLGPACVLLALALVGLALTRVGIGAEQVGASLQQIGVGPVLVALGLVAGTLALRVVRWQMILGWFGHRLPWGLQSRCYLAGLALSSTPGKLGEASRAALLAPHGVPVGHTLGAFLCDRLADVVAVACIGVVAGLAAQRSNALLAGLLVVVGPGALALAALLRSGRIPLGSTPAQPGRFGWAWLAAPLRAWAQTWTAPRALACALLAVLAYGTQALVFAMFVERVHPGVDWTACVAIFATSTLIGAASLVPGGLGAMDGALVWQLQGLGVTTEAAFAATLATRACTLWFAWCVGVGALMSFGRVPAPAIPP